MRRSRTPQPLFNDQISHFAFAAADSHSYDSPIRFAADVSLVVYNARNREEALSMLRQWLDDVAEFGLDTNPAAVSPPAVPEGVPS
ncbi:hypothetical protein [Planctomyces sp. SH-PL14]|uniref:hypothetical protein n=1 Tax=Planctomyces sp. SH-PL14 TaxID=1632864 RepID=UPI00078DA85D|nr:hypothetical protein [Planctomyces sp. SH-PL14]AMV16615.1 hypothetical protein VT03_01915 [Planctomyces sp. SH-PL14]